MSLIADFPEARTSGVHACGSCGKNHHADYGAWCRAERRRLCPSNFERWTEAEHAARRRTLTWEQQQTVWAHVDAWEAYFDGELTLAQVRQHIAYLEPLPSPSVRIQLVSSVQPAPAITREQEEHLMAMAAAGRERAREVEAEFNEQQAGTAAASLREAAA